MYNEVDELANEDKKIKDDKRNSIILKQKNMMKKLNK